MKYLFFVVMIFFTVNVFAQQDKISENLELTLNSTEANEELLVWIFFTDKGNDVDFYLNNPSEVVSEKSLERRRKILSEDKLIDLTDIPVNQNYINDLVSRGFKVKQRSKWLNGVSGYVTKSDLAQIVNLQSVKKADIVHQYKSSRIEEEKIEIKNPVEGSLQPEGITSFDYGSSFTQVNQINVPIAHDSGYTGSGVTICVMDAGFNNLPHEVFQNMNIIAAWDFVNGDPGVGDSSDMGYGGHGTNTLSVIGGFKEGELIGPAFDADFILAKTENTDSEMPVEEDNWIAALEWADSIGVDVTSTSLTYLEFDLPFPSYTWEDMDGNTMRITIAADLGVSKGIVIVNSASNEGFHPSHNTLWGPADGDSVLSIGAVDASGNRASFSSVGPTADGRIKPDVMAMGTGVKMATSWNSSSYTNNGSGTSFSCPLVAGAVALVIQKNPNLSPLEVMESLRLTASQFSNPDRLMGWGIIDTWEAMNFITTGITDPVTNPDVFTLLTNYPNPFNPVTKISWQSPVGSHQTLKVFDVLGNEVATLVDEYKPAGNYEIDFNASGLSSGIYIVTLRTDKSFVSHKISLLK